MKLFFNRQKSFIICLIITILIIINHNNPINESIRSKIMDIAYPIMEAGEYGINSIGNFSSNVQNFFLTYQENKTLKARNEALESYFYRYKQLEEENKQFRSRLNFTDTLENKFISAKIIARSNSSFNQIITVNAGTKDNIEKFQMILVNNQLIGRVIATSHYTSSILLLSSPTSRISVTAMNSKSKFIAAGDGSDYLKCLYLNEQQLQEGELVVTNHDDPSMVPDIIIGAIFKEENNYYIKPSTNYNKIEFVQILQKKLHE